MSEELALQSTENHLSRIRGSFVTDDFENSAPSAPVKKAAAPIKSVSHAFNPKRRLEGFIVEAEGAQTKVALVENGNLHYYRFSTAKLAKKHITEKNQPFEVSEYEITIEQESHCIYVFKPLASKANKRKHPIPMNAERRAKLDFILRNGRDAEA